MKLSNRQRGMSLIEVLIALLITVIVSAGLLSTLQAGVMAYRRLDAVSAEMHQTRLFTTLLESELRNMMFYSEIPFLGLSQQLSFPALVDEFEADSVKKTPSLIRYEYREKTLYRKVAPLRGVFTEKKETSKKWITSLKSFVVQYAYREEENPRIVWLPQWPQGQGLPRGIQITLAFEGKSKKTNINPQSFLVTRKFFNPQGNWGWIKKGLF